MNKETVIAVSLGIIAGVIIAIGTITFVKGSSSKKNDSVLLEKITPVISLQQAKNSDPLLIQEPQNNSVVEKDSVTIKGTVQKNTTVVVQNVKGDEVIKVAGTSFSADVALKPGENEILVSAYNNQSVDTRRLKIYSIQEDSVTTESQP